MDEITITSTKITGNKIRTLLNQKRNGAGTLKTIPQRDRGKWNNRKRCVQNCASTQNRQVITRDKAMPKVHRHEKNLYKNLTSDHIWQLY